MTETTDIKAEHFVDYYDLDTVPSKISKRELQIFDMLGQGRMIGQIGKHLHISIRTVESHRDHIKRKLDIPDILNFSQLAYRFRIEK